MEVIMKNGITFCKYDKYVDMKKAILNFIYECRTDKILYKGNPTDVNYKLIKKVLPADNDKFYKKISKGETIRDTFNNFVESLDCQFCLIYKK